MSEASRDLGASSEPNKVGPDYFAFYTHEIAELLSQDEDFIPFSSETSELAENTNGVVGDKAITRHNYNGKENIVLGSLFCNPIGARILDFKKERLKVLLRQSVIALSQEVDEMLDPVLAIRQIESNLRCRKSLPNYSVAACEGDAEQHRHKKVKLSSSIRIPLNASPISGRVSGEDSDYESEDADLPEKEISNGVRNSCAYYHTTETSNCRPVPEGPEVNNDLQFLLENDAIMVEESIKKHSDELSATLQNMEQQLEEILDIVLSNCRLMTLSEKQQLQKLIQKLPPRNLDRVVEIIRRNKPLGKFFCDEIHVDLEKEDNTTLWRLYYYVEAVENARKLSGLLDLSHTS